MNASSAETPVSDSHATRAHAPLGGSAQNILLNCTGSYFLSKDIPSISSPAADEGTHFHEVAEMALLDFLEYKEEGQIDPDIRYVMHAKDDDMIEHATTYRDVVWKNVFEQSLSKKSYSFEQKFTLDEKLGMEGIADLTTLFTDDHGKRCLIVGDIKYGYNYVEVKNNPQLAFYACAVRAEIKRAGADIDYARVFIYQPRCPRGPAYREVKFTTKQLDRWVAKFYKVATDIFIKQRPKFKSGPHCKYCRARGVCPTYAESNEANTSLKLIDVNSIELPKPEQLSLDQLAKLLLHADALENFLASAKAYVMSQLANGTEVPGLKLVAGKPRRKWSEKAEEVLSMVMAQNDMYEAKLAGITKVEKILKRDRSADAEEIMRVATDKTNAAPLLVPTDDPRPALKNNIDLLTVIEGN